MAPRLWISTGRKPQPLPITFEENSIVCASCICFRPISVTYPGGLSLNITVHPSFTILRRRHLRCAGRELQTTAIEPQYLSTPPGNKYSEGVVDDICVDGQRWETWHFFSVCKFVAATKYFRLFSRTSYLMSSETCHDSLDDKLLSPYPIDAAGTDSTHAPERPLEHGRALSKEPIN